MPSPSAYAVLNGNNNSAPLQCYVVSSNNLITHTLGDPTTGTAVNTVASANSIQSLPVTLVPQLTTYGSTYYNAAVTSTPAQIKASAGNLYQINVYNPQATGTYLSIYGVPSASVTLGTTTPIYQVFIAATSKYDLTFQVPVGGGGSGLALTSYSTATGTGGSSESIVVSAVYM